MKHSEKPFDGIVDVKLDKDFTGETLTSNRIIAHEILREFLNKYKANKHKILERQRLVRKSLNIQRKASRVSNSFKGNRDAKTVEDMQSTIVKSSRQPDGSYIGVSVDQKLYRKKDISSKWEPHFDIVGGGRSTDTTGSQKTSSNNNTGTARKASSQSTVTAAAAAANPSSFEIEEL